MRYRFKNIGPGLSNKIMSGRDCAWQHVNYYIPTLQSIINDFVS